MQLFARIISWSPMKHCKNAVRRIAPHGTAGAFALALLLGAPSLSGCLGSGAQSGDLSVTTQGDVSIGDGLRADEFKDGWAIHFDRFLVHLGGVALGVDSASTVPLGAVPYVLVDLAVPGANQVLVAEDVIAREWPAFTYEVRPVRANAGLGGGVTDADLLKMRSVAASMLVRGVATKGAVQKTFEWTFSLASAYENCRTVESKGVRIEANTLTQVDLTITARPLFEDDLAALKPNLRFEPIAAADVNGDGAVSMAELASVKLTDARASVGFYGTGTYVGVVTLRDFIAAQARLVAGFRGTGSCQLKRL